MEISIIIVNFNVGLFLEQCLYSVQAALKTLTGEVIVIDNKSTDGSVHYLKKRFKSVIFIENIENEGFAKANNRALQYAKGRYVLFLNPDTIVSEDCFSRAISFMDLKSDSGAMGIRMIDGTGNYLPESMRGYPSAWVAFCKMVGLTGLFPNSKTFASYYLGNLDNSKNHEIQAISGAFMLIRTEILQKTGSFDEMFFMYGEDIDLSFRINKAGFKNYYLGESTIIHFKGESTTRDGKYVKLFYKAMSQFVQKHYSGLSTRLLSAVLQAGIGMRGTLAGFTEGKGEVSVTEPENFKVVGDKTATNELSKKVVIAQNSANTLFCVGAAYKYKDTIREIEMAGNGNNFFIHASGSTSIVGSGSKTQRGISIKLE